MRILVVEDEKELNRVLVKHLTNHGYAVDSCLDGGSAVDYLKTTDYDAVILDIMLPGKNGWEILSWIRERGMDLSVLILTAKDAVSDKVRGLDEGADDYLTKPFSLDELMARLRMILRKKTGNRTNRYAAADLILDTSSREVSRGGKQITLSAKEFALLHLLIIHKNQPLSRDQIENHLWGYEYEGASNMVDVYIRYLRKKIDEGFDIKLIQTMRGVGYVLKEQ